MPPTATNNSYHRPAYRAAGALAAAAATVIVALGLSAPSALAADNCVNATVRAQTGSTELPDCRGYEQVSAPYKEGFDIQPFSLRFTDDGNVSYGSYGSFADNPLGITLNHYRATRSAAGWMTVSVAPPASRYDTHGGSVGAVSTDVRSQLWRAYRRDVPGDKFGVFLRGLDGGMTRIGDATDPMIGPYADIAGASADLSHVVLFYGNGSILFEHAGTGNGPPRVASVDNNGQEQGACFNKISPDGRVIVYMTACAPVSTPQVWARVGGSASVRVSASECTRGPGDPGGACNSVSGAAYRGAAADGSRVFFTTSQQLVNSDTDQTEDLYACDIPAGAPAPVGTANPCDTLTQVSGAATGAKVGTGSVPVISEDGSRASFVAEGAALADNLGVNGAAPVAGQSNLYLWIKDAAHPAGTTRFVARLDSDDLGQGQMTPDGRYLLFVSPSALVTSGPGADNTDGAKDVYRYDTDTHSIVRVSTSVSGAGGNGSGFDANLTGVAEASAMSSDGSTVIFDTAEGLSAADTNGGRDVYSWRDGQVSLISAAGGANSAGITRSGRDIFFSTDAQVLGTDGDANTDIYTARVGGGFARAQTSSCSGDGCKGLPTAPPLLDGPGGGGSGGDADEGVRPAIGGIARLSAADRSVLARGGKARLRLRVNRAGTVVLAGRAKVGANSRRVVSSSAKAKRAGRVSVAFALSRAARAELGHRGSLTVGLTVRFTDARPKALTVRLTAAKPKSGRGGSR